MKALKKKTAKAMQAIRDIRDSQSTRLFFESLPEENRRDLYKAMDALKVFYDNIPDKMKNGKSIFLDDEQEK